tara:strand:+ start:56949 stop:57749 length:801 start_codon:yes stop_codon:yes gene_type:complete
MPTRGNSAAPRRGSASQTNQRQAPTRQAPNQGDGSGDVWDDIMNAKQGGSNGTDENGFNKLNTNFWLSNGDEIDIVILDDDPVMFKGHTLKCVTDAGKTFYRNEQCQKAVQQYCEMCESKNKNVGSAKSLVAFRVLDSRGSWDREAGAMDGVPVPKIFFTPIYLAKIFKSLKDDGEGVLSDKVIRLSKDGQYSAKFKLVKGAGGAMHFVDAPEYTGDLFEVLDIYEPMADEDLNDFMNKFVDTGAPAPTARANNRRTGGNTPGSFN